MTEIVYSLQETPTGKWHLKQGGDEDAVSHGFYDSQLLGEAAIQRIIKSTILHYDAYGALIK